MLAALAYAGTGLLGAGDELCECWSNPSSGYYSPQRRPNRPGESFDFYTEGVTPAISAVLAAADNERLRVAKSYGVPTCSLQSWIAAAYGHHATTLHAALVGNPAYGGIKAPPGLDHRYLLEDVPTGLIPLIELGEAAGTPCPTLRALVDLARAVLGGEPWRLPRTLDVLGLEGLSISAIRSLVKRGFVPGSNKITHAGTGSVRRSAPMRARATVMCLAQKHSILVGSMSA